MKESSYNCKKKWLFVDVQSLCWKKEGTAWNFLILTLNHWKVVWPFILAPQTQLRDEFKVSQAVKHPFIQSYFVKLQCERCWSVRDSLHFRCVTVTEIGGAESGKDTTRPTGQSHCRVGPTPRPQARWWELKGMVGAEKPHRAMEHSGFSLYAGQKQLSLSLPRKGVWETIAFWRQDGKDPGFLSWPSRI
jgi:hypothetical protein